MSEQTGPAEVQGQAPEKVERPAKAPRATVEDYTESAALESFGIDVESFDPEMHYRIGAEGAQRQARLYAAGYRPVSRSEDGVRLIIDTEQGAAEDLIRVGDGILMCCPKNLYDGRRERIAKQTKARLSTPESSFRKKAAQADVDVVGKEHKMQQRGGRR